MVIKMLKKTLIFSISALAFGAPSLQAVNPEKAILEVYTVTETYGTQDLASGSGFMVKGPNNVPAIMTATHVIDEAKVCDDGSGIEAFVRPLGTKSLFRVTLQQRGPHGRTAASSGDACVLELVKPEQAEELCRLTEALKVAKQNPEPGEAVRLFAVNHWTEEPSLWFDEGSIFRKHFSSPTKEKCLHVKINSVSGTSGGALLNSKNEVVGVTSCGYANPAHKYFSGTGFFSDTVSINNALAPRDRSKKDVKALLEKRNQRNKSGGLVDSGMAPKESADFLKTLRAVKDKKMKKTLSRLSAMERKKLKTSEEEVNPAELIKNIKDKLYAFDTALKLELRKLPLDQRLASIDKIWKRLEIKVLGFPAPLSVRAKQAFSQTSRSKASAQPVAPEPVAVEA